MCSCHSILECCVTFSGVKLSIRSFVLFMSTSGGYHEYIGGRSVHGGMFSTSGFSIEVERFLPTCYLICIMIFPDVLNIPRCSHDIPPPDVLMISPPPMYS